MAVLPDGRVASGSWDATVRIWNPSSGECELELKGHTSVSRLNFFILVGLLVFVVVCICSCFFVATGNLFFKTSIEFRSVNMDKL